MGELLERNVAVESVEVPQKIKSIKSVYQQELTKIKKSKKKVEQEMMMFINLYWHGLRGQIFSWKMPYQVEQLRQIL